MLDLIGIRKFLHRHPEVSGDEWNTQKKIQDTLSDLNIRFSPIGNTGVIAEIGSGELTVMVRVDIDALPIRETNTFEHRSTNIGVSHKCGHDGHTTIGLGLAEKISKQPIDGVKVLILFQPAEENGLGAQAVIQDNAFKKYSIDFVIALHNVPGYELNQIVVKEHSFTPAVQSLKLRFQGKTAHAAEPENGFNPHFAIAELIANSKEIENSSRNSDDFLLFTPIYSKIGEKNYGISPGYGEIHFTIRSWEQSVLEKQTAKFIDIAKETAIKHNLILTFETFEKFHSNQNNPEVVKAISEAANILNLSTFNKPKPFSWGEDFGLFTQHIKGAMFGLGAGMSIPALHNPDYDFPDEITPTGINIFYQTIIQLKHAK